MKWEIIVGTTSLLTDSTKVFPTQILYPPRNGEKLNGFLFLPSGVRKYGLSELKRSGMNFSGSIHSEGLLHRSYIEIETKSPFLIVSGPVGTVSLIAMLDE